MRFNEVILFVKPNSFFSKIKNKNNMQNPIEVAKTITNPDLMLGYIETSIAYIRVCRTRIHIAKMNRELGGISDKEFKEAVLHWIEKIREEVLCISIYLTSDPFRRKYLSTVNGTCMYYNEKLINKYIPPVLIARKVKELILEVKEMIGNKEYNELPDDLKRELEFNNS